MKTLYYECFAGISGDMNLGAMIDLGVDIDQLKSELSKLNLDSEFQLKVRRDEKHGIFGTKVDVVDLNNMKETQEHPTEHPQEHPHEHQHAHSHEHAYEHAHANANTEDHKHTSIRDYKEIRSIINESTLSDRVKRDSIKVFHIIATAEAKIHDRSIDEVHFHEVGAIDSIIDVVGAALCLEILQIDSVWASTVETGSGFVRCAHGLMPIPAPATSEILTGVPIKSDVSRFEMTTPTGAAILKAFVSHYTDSKTFIASKIGYGLGTRNLEIPNLVRVFLLEYSEQKTFNPKDDDDKEQWILETNIDDMSSELLVYAEEKLFSSGALDVYKTPIIMKKGRAAIKLTVLTDKKEIKNLQKIIFSETTSIGMRMYPVEKVKIERKFETIETAFGPIVVKKAYFEDQLVNVKPEYEQIKKYASEMGVSMKQFYNQILKLIIDEQEKE